MENMVRVGMGDRKLQLLYFKRAVKASTTLGVNMKDLRASSDGLRIDFSVH